MEIAYEVDFLCSYILWVRGMMFPGPCLSSTGLCTRSLLAVSVISFEGSWSSFLNLPDPLETISLLRCMLWQATTC